MTQQLRGRLEAAEARLIARWDDRAAREVHLSPSFGGMWFGWSARRGAGHRSDVDGYRASMPVFALWSAPRARSTAFFRSMVERGDLLALHEPFFDLLA